MPQSSQSVFTDGLRRVPEPVRAAHVEFVRSLLTREGGFPGRDSGPNLRSTWFGVRALSMLEALSPDLARRIGAFVRARVAAVETVEDCCALAHLSKLLATGPEPVVPDFALTVQTLLEAQRSGDGGYRKANGLIGGSTTHSWLAYECSRALDLSTPRPGDLASFILGRLRPDGGFIETAALRKSGATSTSAALSLLGMLDEAEGTFQRTPDIVQGSLHFLKTLQSPEGGFLANRQTPLADMVSTFHALWTLHEFQAQSTVDCEAARRYVETMAWTAGGFRGGEWDEDTDIEYTFYGLASLALLV